MITGFKETEFSIQEQEQTVHRSKVNKKMKENKETQKQRDKEKDSQTDTKRDRKEGGRKKNSFNTSEHFCLGAVNPNIQIYLHKNCSVLIHNTVHMIMCTDTSICTD